MTDYRIFNYTPITPLDYFKMKLSWENFSKLKYKKHLKERSLVAELLIFLKDVNIIVFYIVDLCIFVIYII